MSALDVMQVLLKHKEETKKLKEELKRYKKGFKILSCYFDSISDEEQPKVAKKLKKLNL